jgi:hypothetical protein
MSFSLLQRSATVWEVVDFTPRCDIVLAFQLANKAAVSQVLDHLDRAVTPLHLKYDGSRIHAVPSPAPRQPLPNQIRDLHRAAEWAFDHCPLNFADRLGMLAYNDSKVVLNVSHAFSDGGYFKFLTEHLFDANPPARPALPPRFEEMLPVEFAAARDVVLPWSHDPDLTRIYSRHQKLPVGSGWAKYETLRFSGDEVKCFNRQIGKFENTNDYLWLALLLASAVPGGQLPTFSGISTCADLRRRLSPPVDGSILKFFAHINAHTPILGSDTLREVGRRMRADLMRRYDALEDIARIKYVEKQSCGKPIPGIILEVTNMGPIHIKWPVVDAWACLRVGSARVAESLAIMGFSVMGEKKKDLIVRLRYGEGWLGDDEVFEIANMVGHVLKNISLDRTVQSTFDELKQFYADRR